MRPFVRQIPQQWANSVQTKTECARTLMRLSFNLGWAVGAGIGGFVAHHSYQLLFWVDSVTNILAAILLWYLLPDKYTTSSLAKKENATQKISVLSDKVFVQFILISVIFLSCFVQLFTNLPVYFKKELHFWRELYRLFVIMEWFADCDDRDDINFLDRKKLDEKTSRHLLLVLRFMY